MWNFFKRKNKKLQPPERRLIFKMIDGSWKQSFHVEGITKKETVREIIATTQRMYKENYVGTRARIKTSLMTLFLFPLLDLELFKINQNVLKNYRK